MTCRFRTLDNVFFSDGKSAILPIVARMRVIREHSEEQMRYSKIKI